ncbi:MAG: TetR/AcrR family transcriptional regulator [Cyanobacteria bacterium P01_F01_bin.86]
MSESTQSKSKQTLLITAAAVLARNPGASLGEIAAQAKIGRATLYRHFPSRDVLIRELSMAAIAAIDQVTADIKSQNLSADEALLAFFQGVVPLGDRFHFLVTETLACQHPDVKTAYDRQLNELYEFVTQLKQAGVIAPEIPNTWVTTVIDALIWTAWSAVDSGDLARNDAAALTYRTLLTGLSRSVPANNLDPEKLS